MPHHAIKFSAVVSALLAFVSGPAQAQAEYPSRPIRLIVPVPPGPLLDAVPRIIADKLAVKWAQPVIVENRPGAAANLAAEAVINAAPDGYTLLVAPPGPLTVSQHIYPKLGFNPTTFVPVSTLLSFPLVLVVNPKVPASNMVELIAYAKANPGKLTYGSPGIGSTPQLAMEQLMIAAGIRMVHVPYQGLGPALRDLVGGHIDVMLDAPSNSMEQVKEGKLRALGVTGAEPEPALSGVPVISATLPGFIHGEWFAMVAPPKTPPEITAKLSQAIAEILAMPDVAQRLAAYYVTPLGSSPGETAALLTRESARWRELVAATGLKVN